MTRKDYIKVAEAIRATGEEFGGGSDIIGAIAARLAAVCAEDNANFDPKRFFTACGLYKGN